MASQQSPRLRRGLQLYIAVFTRVTGLALLTLSATSAGQSTAQNIDQSAQQNYQHRSANNSQSSNRHPQYTEGACILIAAQIKRFEQQRFRC